MSEIKGYVVRGTWRGVREVYAYWWAPIADVQWTDRRDGVPKDGALLFATLGDAIRAVFKSSHLSDVHILAVAEDGTETPLPSYEEALAAIEMWWAPIDVERNVQRLVRAHRLWGRGLSNVSKGALERLVRTYVDAFARWSREVQRLWAERDARDKAWARLASAGFVQAVERRPDTLAEYDAARRALLGLGVDVDALLEAAVKTEQGALAP